MSVSPTVFLFVWTGSEGRALEVVRAHYGSREIEVLPKRRLREAGWKGQIRFFSKLRGHALVFFVDEMADLQEPLLLRGLAALHHCRETAFADASGAVRAWRSWQWIPLLPVLAWSAVCDVLAFAFTALVARRLTSGNARVEITHVARADFDVAYVHPYPLNVTRVGGAMSHVRGIVGGMQGAGASIEVFSGSDLGLEQCPSTRMPARRRFFLLAESMLLSYNFRFAQQVLAVLNGRTPRCLYQRHGRWVIAGVLLARKLRVPLVLEYNGSEVWIAQHWHPARFMPMLRLCEQAAVRNASLIVVVSEPLRQELIEQGIPAERVLVSPNAVNPQEFRPGCGGGEQRRQWGFNPEHVVIGFLSTFSQWHGVQVLQDAILELLEVPEWQEKLRFLLIGEGILQPEMKQKLQEHVDAGRVIFPGSVAHRDVPRHLDAADILVSPHVPMPDGRPFFGSPTKLFEYLAMGKSIVASKLDQIGEILEHDRTAWLTTPGDVRELTDAIIVLARDARIRVRLGEAARNIAIERHTWSHNAARTLARLRPHSNTASAVARTV